MERRGSCRAPPAQTIVARVHGHPVHPALGVVGGRHCGHVPERFEECFLGDVRSLVCIAQDPRRQEEEAFVQLCVEALECLRAPFAQLPGEVLARVGFKGV